MDFEFGTAENLKVTDAELSELLSEVYVGGNFTDPEHAATLFDPLTVRQRGTILAARNKANDEISGVIIFVPPTSNARRLATGNEAELQLLGVKSKYRTCGIGTQLVENAISMAKSAGCQKIVLWTQRTMEAAQKLYESFGFSQIKSFEQNGRIFYMYSLDL